MAIATQLERYSLLIDGQLVESASGKTFTSVNPADNEPLAEVAEGGEEDADRAVGAARQSSAILRMSGASAPS